MKAFFLMTAVLFSAGFASAQEMVNVALIDAGLASVTQMPGGCSLQRIFTPNSDYRKAQYTFVLSKGAQKEAITFLFTQKLAVEDDGKFEVVRNADNSFRVAAIYGEPGTLNSISIRGLFCK
jgi:hypothetical protein